MNASSDRSDWIQLLTKLIWPLFIVIMLIVFNRQVTELYQIVLESIKSGRSVEIGGFLKLGDAARETEVAELSSAEMSIEGVGGQSGVARKGGVSHLRKVQQELRENPNKSINTLLVAEDTVYSPDLLREYVGSLGLKYVLFQKSGKFDGWILSSSFIAQLPEDTPALYYTELKESLIGVSMQKVGPKDSAKSVLSKLQQLHIDSIPVVDDEGNWLYFANRGEILTNLMSNILLDKSTSGDGGS